MGISVALIVGNDIRFGCGGTGRNEQISANVAAGKNRSFDGGSRRAAGVSMNGSKEVVGGGNDNRLAEVW